MRKSYITLTLLALLTTCALSTFIITSGNIKQFDLGHGKTMVVFGQDAQDQSGDDIEPVQPAETYEINKRQSSRKPSDSPSKGKPADKSSDGKSDAPIYCDELKVKASKTVERVERVAFVSSFGSLGKRSDEQTYRTLIQQRNLKWVEEQNQQPQLTFTMGATPFIGLTVEEFSKLYLTLNAPKNVPKFDFDIKKEIKKHRKLADEVIESTFGYKPYQRKRAFVKSSYSYSYNTDCIPRPTPSPTPPSAPTPTPPSTPSNSNSNTDIPTIIPDSSSNSTPSTTPSSTLKIDWTTDGYVSAIKNQGSCGSCYSFSTLATIQSAFLLKNKAQYSSIDLSEQQIVDCSSPQGNAGCNGGWLSYVYSYVISYGLTDETSYPYTQVAASSCKTTGGSFKISNYQGGALSNCSALAAMVSGRPVAVAVSAGNSYWQSYTGGIMNTCSGDLDHGVTLVGVYQDETQNYWKVKNSWGTAWGEKGFIRLDRSVDNICLICSYGFYPQL